MKKITLLAVAALCIAISSCRKDYVCECTTISSGTKVNGAPMTNGGAKTVNKRSIPKATKKTARSICGGGSQATTSSYSDPNQGITYNSEENFSTTCKLKG